MALSGGVASADRGGHGGGGHGGGGHVSARESFHGGGGARGGFVGHGPARGGGYYGGYGHGGYYGHGGWGYRDRVYMGRPFIGSHYYDYRYRPELIVEDYGVRDGYAWVRGSWSWNGAEWIWAPGYYEPAY
jgi:hypothetical protein